ncbi:MAG TPA: hypothetical protein VHZ07_24840 [Bryobacteraceae bacterium]|jgi:predicted PurR-regulated permease PerM|nr:hypothetical protein [Bryobacteraceae bacterium]
MPATTVPPRKTGLRRWQWLAIIFVILLLAAFLLGYIPQSQQVNSLTAELKTARDNQHQLAAQLQIDTIRDQFSRAYLETTRNNFGLASQNATRGFDVIASASNISNPPMKSALEEISGQRNPVLSALAKADPNVRNQLAAILDKMDKAGGHS